MLLSCVDKPGLAEPIRTIINAMSLLANRSVAFTPAGQGEVRVFDNGESLVPISAPISKRTAYDGTSLPLGESPLRVRTGVLERLRRAAEALPPEAELIVLDGWRSLDFQRRLTEYYGAAATKEGYVSSVDASSPPPPHVTGGAVDLTLGVAGHPLALGSDFDEFSELAHLESTERGPSADPSRKLRRILMGVMTGAGFAPYQKEWWHYSYGDTNWARYYGRDHSEYGAAAR